MKRLQQAFLEKWFDKKQRKPLLIRGARQVGKTWLVREFSKKFSSFVEINLESHPEYTSLFNEYYGKPEELVKYLSAAAGTKIVAGQTLLFIDEVQESPKAILALRYFYEKLPSVHVIAAGSLVEFALEELSFPVGRIEFFYLFPMNFKEYLWATSNETLIETWMNLDPKRPLPKVLHERFVSEIIQYSLIGGMPEAVKNFNETQDLASVQAVHQVLLSSFRADFNKYASHAQIPHLRMVFDAAPLFLGQKFKYAHVSRDARSRELSQAVDLLEQAGLLYRVCQSHANGIPLSAERDPSKFKIFFVDIGLCHRVLGLQLTDLFMKRKQLLVNRGGIAEQLFAQEWISLTEGNNIPSLHYWHREAKSSQAEVDFVIESRDEVIPIEVKSGTKGRMRSLLLFLEEKKRKTGVKISLGSFGRIKSGQKEIVEIPVYAVSKAAEVAR